MGSNLWKQRSRNGLLQPPSSLSGEIDFKLYLRVIAKPHRSGPLLFCPTRRWWRIRTCESTRYNSQPSTNSSHCVIEGIPRIQSAGRLCTARGCQEGTDHCREQWLAWLGALLGHLAIWDHDLAKKQAYTQVSKIPTFRFVKVIFYPGWLIWQKLKDWVWRISWSSWQPNTIISLSVASHTLW